MARGGKLQGSLQERIGEAIDQADAQSVLSSNRPGGGKEFERPRFTDQTRQSLRAAPTSDNAEPGAGMREPGLY